MRRQRTRTSCSVLLRACPMCRVPVTFGGGMTTEKGSPGASTRPRKYPFSSQNWYHRASTWAGSYTLGKAAGAASAEVLDVSVMSGDDLRAGSGEDLSAMTFSSLPERADAFLRFFSPGFLRFPPRQRCCRRCRVLSTGGAALAPWRKAAAAAPPGRPPAGSLDTINGDPYNWNRSLGPLQAAAPGRRSGRRPTYARRSKSFRLLCRSTRGG